MRATARPRASSPRKARSKTQNVLSRAEIALALDTKESGARFKLKEAAARKQYGKNWRSFVRPGRVFTRVETIHPIKADQEVSYVLCDDPGWEFRCPNCGTRSRVNESMIATYIIVNRGLRQIYTENMLESWEEQAAEQQKAGYKPSEKPTAATAGCPNCHFRPGAPE